MKVSGFRVYRFALPLAAPVVLAGQTLRTREGLLLELVGDGGASGWGEASPLPGFSQENPEDAERALMDLGTRAIGLDVQADAPETREPSARFGFETAWLSLRAAGEGKPLPGLMAPEPSATVATAALLSGDRVLEDAAMVRAEGYAATKLKVGGGSVGEAAGLTREVAARLGEGVALRLDANRAWSLQEAVRFVELLDGLPFEYLEEPLAESEDLGSLVREAGVPVALDESLAGLEPERLGDRHAYARAVVLKPTVLGLRRSWRFAREASRLGMVPVVSAAYEGGVGTAALVALAAAIGDAPAGLDTYRRLAGDVISPRLPLPAPAVEVGEVFAAPLAVDRDVLMPVGEGS